MVPGRREHQHDMHPEATSNRDLDRFALGMELANELLRTPRPRLDLEEDEISARGQPHIGGSSAGARDGRLDGRPPAPMPQGKESFHDSRVRRVVDERGSLRVQGEPEVRTQHRAGTRPDPVRDREISRVRSGR
jgi:hypothetical protein